MVVSPEIIERIREALPLADFIGKDLTLKRAGATIKGLCPFHNERTPSFVVYPDQNRYYCFGCGQKGDIFNYVQERDHLGFSEAVRFLAEVAGIKIEASNPAVRAQEAFKRRWLELYEKSLGYYRHALKVLPAGRPALDYLTGRGLAPQVIDEFRLGYALPHWDALSRRLLDDNYQAQTLIDAGLARLSRQGQRLYDYFRDRVIFPIADERGRVVAFGGRVLDNSEPKYLNSPESPLYKKRELLYGMDLARKSIIARDQVVIVEGYLDVIGLYQAGIQNVVAPLGTSFTSSHLANLKKLTSRVIFLFDGDRAGQKAAFSASLLALNANCSATVVLLPKNQDAFDLSLDSDQGQIDKLFKQGVPIADYLINTIWQKTEVHGTDRPMMFLQELYQFLNEVEDKIKTSLLLQKASVFVGIDSDEIELDYARQRGRRVKRDPSQEVKPPDPGEDTRREGDFEFYLVRLTCFDPSLWALLLRELDQGLVFEDARALYLLEVVRSLAKENQTWSIRDLVTRVDQDDLREILDEDMASGRLEIDREKQFEDTLNKLRIKTIRRERALLDEEMRRLKIQGLSSEVGELQQKILFLRRQEDELARGARSKSDFVKEKKGGQDDVGPG